MRYSWPGTVGGLLYFIRNFQVINSAILIIEMLFSVVLNRVGKVYTRYSNEQNYIYLHSKLTVLSPVKLQLYCIPIHAVQ